MTTAEGRRLYDDARDAVVVLDAELDGMPERDVSVYWWAPHEPNTQLIQHATFRGTDPHDRVLIRSTGWTAGKTLDALLAYRQAKMIPIDEANAAIKRLEALWHNLQFVQIAYRPPRGAAKEATTA